MRRLVDALQHRALVPILIGLYVAQQWSWPSHNLYIFLIAAVVIAARIWEVRGAVLTATAACSALLFGLRQGWLNTGMVTPLMLDTFLWTSVALFLLATNVGSLSRKARQLVGVNHDLLQAQQRLAALHTIALSLSTTLDVTVLLDKILEQLGTLWGYDHGAIVLLDEPTGDMVVAGARDYAVGVGHRIPAGHGIAGAVVGTGRPVCVGDVTVDPRYTTGLAEARSELAVPLLWEGRTLGVLNVESRLVNAYGPADIALLSTVAEQAAAAIGNARLHEQTRELALTDPHTGLYNYRHFQEQVTDMVRDSQVTGQPFSLIMLDLDFFKRINDTYGHPTGDAVLEQVAQLLRETCRQGDLCYRYGGEEFAVTLPGASHEVALRVAERIKEKITGSAFQTKSGRALDLGITASIGLASFPRDGVSHGDLLLAADRALYQAKSAGRNRVYADGQPAGPEPSRREPA